MEQKNVNRLNHYQREDRMSENSEHMYEQSENAQPIGSEVVLHRSILNDLPLIPGSLVVAGGLSWIAFQKSVAIDLLTGVSSYLLLSVFLGITLIIVLLLVTFRQFNTRYLIAKDGVKVMRGIFSNNQIEAKLEYYQIRGIEIRRSLFQRFINTGDLHVRGATSDDTEVSLAGIYNPYLYQKLIENRHRVEVQNLKSTWVNDSGQTIRQDTHPQLI